MILAAIASLCSYLNFHTVEASSWAVEHSLAGNRISLAGWWTIFFSLPLFVFLFLRGAWRHLVWARLLRKLATLDLRPVATHPDGRGGLAFLGQYPNAYAIFVFGMSCAIAAAVAKHNLNEGLTTATLSTVMSGWLAIVIGFFAYPLSAFSPPLDRLKEQGLSLLSAQATNFYRSAEQRRSGRTSLPVPSLSRTRTCRIRASTTKQRASSRPSSSAGLRCCLSLPPRLSRLRWWAATMLPTRTSFRS